MYLSVAAERDQSQVFDINFKIFHLEILSKNV